MELIFALVFQLLIMMMTIDAKNYNAVDLNRIRITDLYRNHLLTRPSTNTSSQTVVAVGLGIIEVAGIDPQKQVITLNANFEVKWCDHLLQWNITEQLCLKRSRPGIFFNTDEIWIPDIAPINGPGNTEQSAKYQYPVLGFCTGDVRWSYQDKLASFCEIKVRNFPFDRQYCSILLQSTIYDSSQLKLRSLYDVVRLYNFINTEWEITHATIEEIDLYNPYHGRDFSTIKIDIELERLSRFYVIKIIVPYCIISSLALFSFCLPTDSGEKVALTVSILLSLSIYLQTISDYVPKTERVPCILTLYSNIIFLIVFLSCVFNIFNIFIYYHELYSLKTKIPKRHQKSVLLTVHESLLQLNKQRWAFLKKRQNVTAHVPERMDIDALEILYDIRYIRETLMNVLIRNDPGEFRQHLGHHQRSAKKLAILIDRMLFFVYLIAMPLIFVITFNSTAQPGLLSLTNQLHDLRKNATDPRPLFRDCPT